MSKAFVKDDAADEADEAGDFEACLIGANVLSFITGSTLMLLGSFKKLDGYKNFKDCIINDKR